MLVYSIRAYKLYLTESANWIHVIFMSMYPIMGTAMYGSIYITLAVSIERYLGKYLPTYLYELVPITNWVSSCSVRVFIKIFRVSGGGWVLPKSLQAAGSGIFSTRPITTNNKNVSTI